MRPLGLLLIGVLLAGCASTAPEAPAEPVAEVAATATTGILRCVVVDEAIIPIEGAMVFLDTGALQYTGTDGECAFGGLEPGPHTLRVSKIGHHATEAVVDVVAGDDAPDFARVQLDPDPATTPFVQPYTFNGRIGCATSHIAVCGGELAAITGDASSHIYDFDTVPTWITTEAVWTASTAGAHQMRLVMGVPPVDIPNQCCETTGISPLQWVGSAFSFHGTGVQDQIYSQLYAYEMEGTSPEDNLGQCIRTICDGPGFAVQQEFEVFAHLFHNFVPREDYRFTEHGEPQLPP